MAKAAQVVSKTVAPASVDFVREELRDMMGQYELIRDCLTGDQAIKSRGIAYLPMPEAHDQSPENIARYDNYRNRAVFYNVTKRTLKGFVGEVFIIKPAVTVPTLLESVIKDANGSGTPLEQLAQTTEEYVLAYGRAGLFTDYPNQAGRPTTRRDQMNGNIRPTISLYAPWNIINWRTVTRNSQVDLSLIVLKERYEVYDDGFAIEYADQYRVLRLVDGLYVQEIWRGSEGVWTVYQKFEPVDAKGKRLENIPFTFIGAVNNDPDVDDAPMYDLASLNIAHYRNSADYEESSYMTGQATPVITGISQHWYDEVLKGRVEFGSHAAIALPEGGQAALLQMQPNSVPFEAMQHKERQMVALGAKLVEQKAVQRTATETRADVISEKSVLTTVTENVSAGFKFSLEWCGIFAGTTTVAEDAKRDTIEFTLNTEYDFSTATPEEIKAVVELWQKEAITFSEMRDQLRDSGYATLDDKKARAELEKERARNITENERNGNNPDDPFTQDDDE